MSLQFVARDVPLRAAAVVARGPVAIALARRLLSRDDDALRALTGVESAELLLLTGEEGQLPWVDGVEYLGLDGDVLLPTTLAPSVHPLLLGRAARARPDVGSGPLAVLPTASGVTLVPLREARPVSRARLQQWLEQAEAR